MKWLCVVLTYLWAVQSVTASLLDTSFDIGSGANGLVEQALELPDGKVLVCGNFTTFNGKDRSYVARLNNDGSVDLSFEAHPSYWVRHMVVQSDGKIVIGGYFGAVDDQPRNLIARLNPNGSLDTSFDPGKGAEEIIAGGIDGNITPFVFWIELQSDGKILITGNFRNYNGVSSTGLARLNPNGSLDETFKIGSGLDSWGRVIKVAANSQIYVGGWFTSYNGFSANRLVRINPDGSPDTSFHPYYGDATAVYSIVELPDGKLITAGHARDTDSPFKEVVRLYTDGSIDESWKGSTNEKTETLLQQPNGQLILGGYFSLVNGEPRSAIGRLNADGTIDPGLFSLVDNFIWTVAPAQNNKVLISGGFTSVDGVSRSGVARLTLPESTGPISTPPPAAPKMSNVLMTDNKFRVTIGTTAGNTYTLEAADDPTGPWSALASSRALENTMEFEDPNIVSKRYYRVLVR